jgi:hypothetical protein
MVNLPPLPQNLHLCPHSSNIWGQRSFSSRVSSCVDMARSRARLARLYANTFCLSLTRLLSQAFTLSGFAFLHAFVHALSRAFALSGFAFLHAFNRAP